VRRAATPVPQERAALVLEERQLLARYSDAGGAERARIDTQLHEIRRARATPPQRAARVIRTWRDGRALAAGKDS